MVFEKNRSDANKIFLEFVKNKKYNKNIKGLIIKVTSLNNLVLLACRTNLIPKEFQEIGKELEITIN